ncbi:MAG: hypothetical protein C0412_04445 [Flavobacterium sp.]|nr:hypothetical protein [Flavobacterium sp.]
MRQIKIKPATIDEYIGSFPLEVQKILQELRIVIKKAAPDAEEKISYQMPAFGLNGILVYFAAHKSHIGFYPTASGIAAFKDKISKFKTSRGTVQFPFDKPLPIRLIKDIVKFRAKENLKKGNARLVRKKIK